MGLLFFIQDTQPSGEVLTASEHSTPIVFGHINGPSGPLIGRTMEFEFMITMSILLSGQLLALTSGVLV